MSNAVVMAYVLPMLLGQTYHIGKDSPGIQIFNSTAVENSAKIQNYFTDTRYRMVDSSDDVKDLLDIKGMLSLKVKAGLVDIAGEGNYLKDRASRSHSIEMLIKVDFESVTRSLTSDWTPNKDWTLQDREFLGTHYCRSITYGGELIALVRFLATNQFDKEIIKGAIQAGVNAKSFQTEIGAKLEKLKEELHDSSSMEIRYYATVPIPGVSYDISGLMKLVDEFPTHVKKHNNGIGNPLRMELISLSALESSVPAYYENRALHDQLEDMENQFDDLLTTRKELSLWLSELPPIIPESVNEKVYDFTEKLETLTGVYSEIISDLDLSSGVVAQSFDKAFSAYADGGSSMPNKYQRKFKELKMLIYKENPELQPVHGGASYVRWGNGNCMDGEQTVVSGVAVGSNLKQTGGSSNFICSPNNQHVVQSSFSNGDERTDGDDDDGIQNRLLNGPIRYGGELKIFQEVAKKAIPCAVCRSTRSTNAMVFHGFNSCPEGWSVTYEGFTMAPGRSSIKNEYICVDESLQGVDTTEDMSNNENHVEIKEVQAKCGTLPCEDFKSNTLLRCVMCIKKTVSD